MLDEIKVCFATTRGMAFKVSQRYDPGLAEAILRGCSVKSLARLRRIHACMQQTEAVVCVPSLRHMAGVRAFRNFRS